jgi:hypothetical protein
VVGTTNLTTIKSYTINYAGYARIGYWWCGCGFKTYIKEADFYFNFAAASVTALYYDSYGKSIGLNIVDGQIVAFNDKVKLKAGETYEVLVYGE